MVRGSNLSELVTLPIITGIAHVAAGTAYQITNETTIIDPAIPIWNWKNTITQQHLTRSWQNFMYVPHITIGRMENVLAELKCALTGSSSFVCSLNPIRQTIYTPTPIPLPYNPFTIVLHKRLSAYMFRAPHTPACWIGTKRNKDFHPATPQPIGNQDYWPNPSRMWI